MWFPLQRVDWELLAVYLLPASEVGLIGLGVIFIASDWQ